MCRWACCSAFGASTAERDSARAMAADPLLKPMLDNFDAEVQFHKAQPDAPPDQGPRHRRPSMPVASRAGRGAGGGGAGGATRRATSTNRRFSTTDDQPPSVRDRGAICTRESIVGGSHGIDLYPHVMETMVKTWRKLWGEGDFPFTPCNSGVQNISNNPRVRKDKPPSLAAEAGYAAPSTSGTQDVHHTTRTFGDRLMRMGWPMSTPQHRVLGPVYQSMP